VRRQKNQDKGNIVEKECPDQADGGAVLTFISRQPASNSQGDKGDTGYANEDNPDRLGERPYYEGNHYRRSCNQGKTG